MIGLGWGEGELKEGEWEAETRSERWTQVRSHRAFNAGLDR